MLPSTDNTEIVVEARGLVKRFGDTTALDGVDLTVPRGLILGLLGPNGAGKTTAVRVLATLLTTDAGTARVNGHDVTRDAARVREAIGLTGQYASVDDALSGRQNLVMIGRLLDLRRAEAKARARELLEVSEAADRPARTYSGGMRRRLDLAASLVGRPSVIFLDEPTTGLDPSKRGDMWQVVRTLVADGATVLLTTQYLEGGRGSRSAPPKGGRRLSGATARAHARRLAAEPPLALRDGPASAAGERPLCLEGQVELPGHVPREQPLLAPVR